LSSSAGSLQWGAGSALDFAAALFLAAVFAGSVYAAWQRLGGNARARWAGVLVLNATACLAIFALLAPPVLQRPATASITLLTEGALSAPEAIADVYVAPGAGDYGRGPAYLLDMGQLLIREPSLGALSVSGHGLDASEWRRLPDDLAVHYEPLPISGLTSVSWQHSLGEGEPLIVTGRYLPDSPAAARSLELVDPAGLAVATHDLLVGDTFELTTVPKAPGIVDYRLRVRGDEGELESEPVPVHVRSARRPLIYVMQSAPSFETRRLKNWAGDNAATVVVDTVITRDRELGQRVNADTLDADSLSPALLDVASLAVLDGRAWAGLDATRRAWFEAAVRDGMGLLILADEDLAEFLEGNTTLLQGFGLTKRERDQEGYVPVWAGSESEQRLPLLAFDLEHRGEGALTQVESGDVVEAYHAVGLGRVAVSVLRERHRWFTSGDRSTYTSYWARLLSRIGRPRPLPYLLPVQKVPLSSPEKRLRICAMTGGTEVAMMVAPLHSADSLELETGAATTGGPRRCAEFWPWQAGWHRVGLYASDADEALSEDFFYVFADDEWQAHRRYSRQQATLERAAAVGPDIQPQTRTAREAISPLWPWLLLMLSASLLWLERRLY
jgi:hypothetical protein